MPVNRLGGVLFLQVYHPTLELTQGHIDAAVDDDMSLETASCVLPDEVCVRLCKKAFLEDAAGATVVCYIQAVDGGTFLIGRFPEEGLEAAKKACISMGIGQEEINRQLEIGWPVTFTPRVLKGQYPLAYHIEFEKISRG